MAENFLQANGKIKNIICLSLIFIVNFLLRIPITAMGFFAMTDDQGRDLLQASNIVYNHNLTLIGPTTGIHGIFYGPSWYYLLSVVLFLSGGNPQTIGIFFGLLGVLTVLSIYFYLKSTLKSLLLTFLLTLIASMSSLWMFWPTLIWSTSLAPILTVGFFYCLNRIIKNPSKLNFLFLGLVSFLTVDSEFPWGLVLVVFTLTLPILFKKTYLKKNFLLTLLGFLLVLTPRIIFNFRNQFLELNVFLAYLKQPKVYGQDSAIQDRFLYRLDLFLNNFSAAFTSGNKLLALLVILLLVVTVLLLIKFDKNNWKKLKNDFIFRCSLALLLTAFIFFTVFKDTVWDYYLIGLPLTYLIVISRIFNFSLISKKYVKRISWFTILVLIVLNINWQLLHPFKITWQGDGAIYRNQKKVMDFIASEKPHNYAIYNYSPSIFDNAFDYLISWYVKTGKIERPQSNSRLFYMIIREATSDRYLKIGWYGDKTRDKTIVLERKYFPGNIMLEKHQRNENQ